MFEYKTITPSAKFLQNFIPTEEFKDCEVLDITFVNMETGEEDYFERFYTFNNKVEELTVAVVERIRYMPTFIERSVNHPLNLEHLDKYLLRIEGNSPKAGRTIEDEDYLYPEQTHSYGGREVFEILLAVEGELGFPVSSPFKSLFNK